MRERDSSLDLRYSQKMQDDEKKEIDMCPQPASRVKWNGNYMFGNEVLHKKPELGCIVAAVIAGWSTTETHLGRAFATMIGTKQPVTMTMYEAMRSFEVQRDILKAAAYEVLPNRYAMLFEASLSVLIRASIDRNKFAHWIWGASADPDLDALFLVEPKHFWKLAVAQIKHWNDKRHKNAIEKIGPYEFSLRQPKLESKNIFVYRLKDLQDSLSRIERAFWIADRLRNLVGAKPPLRRKIYDTLYAQPDIRSFLEDMKKKAPRQKPPKPTKQQDKSDRTQS